MNQPLAIVPATSNTPTSASRLAAVVTGMPWSCAAGMKCVPTRPAVVAPQIANDPASSQNALLRAASRSTRSERASALPSVTGAGGASVAPYGNRPRSAGRSRISSSTGTATTVDASETTTTAVRQPCCSTSRASSGMKTRLPAAPPAVSTPVTRPCLALNQRPETVVAKAPAIEPLPSPTRTPQHRISCQLCVIRTVRPAPVEMVSSAQTTTSRTPKRSISAAANGAVSPYSVRLTETALAIVACDQPNSLFSASIIRPGVERNPAEPTRTSSATAATTQA